ncbi:MAG: hypothetical protein CMH53_05665, partial [Myxococcales bacterium]|nr:hypothetical protein [Myxococcales bacterium]
GLVSHLRWRTHQIDHAVSAAIARGARQCVVVGAGYDDRAHRLEALSRLPVWELDHPASQRSKRDRTGRLYTLASQVVYVALDLSHEDLAIRLLDAGFDPSLQTVWVWEGCTMYLPHDDIATCLERMASISAPASTLVSTYAVPQLSPIDALTVHIARRFHWLGEPLEGLVSDADWQALITARGWSNRHDQVCESVAPAFRAERVHQATRVARKHNQGDTRR